MWCLHDASGGGVVSGDGSGGGGGTSRTHGVTDNVVDAVLCRWVEYLATGTQEMDDLWRTAVVKSATVVRIRDLLASQGTVGDTRVAVVVAECIVSLAVTGEKVEEGHLGGTRLLQSVATLQANVEAVAL